MEHTLEQLSQCPLCGHSGFSHFLTCKDHSVSKKDFTIDECNSCGLRFTNPRPDDNAIGPYYNSPAYVSHNDTSKGLLFTIYQSVKKYALRNKAGILATYSPGKSLLEYGAGTGDFAGTMQGNGWDVLAYEPDPSANARISTKYPAVSLTANIADITDDSRSAITLWHVLEHVHRLDETLAHFHRILNEDGCLIVAVPNCDSYDAQFHSGYWAAYDVPRHLYHFRPNDLRQLLAKHGFVLVEKKPMWFDSYYVGLLSESYKRPTAGALQKLIRWLGALTVGSISNIKCIEKVDKCSSIIYILKKA